MDETALSKGEVVTFVTNKDHKGMKGSLVAVIFSIKMRDIIEVLETAIPQGVRDRVREVTTDLSGAMQAAAHKAFRHAANTIDRFHVQMLVNESANALRLKARNAVRDNENAEHKLCRENNQPFVPTVLSNGETPLQALNRAKYAFVTDDSEWTEEQKWRVDELTGYFPELYSGLQVVKEFRSLFNLRISPKEAIVKIKEWCKNALKQGGKTFKTTVKTIKNNIFAIANYFANRATNAFAESFNAKVKLFRTQLRGISDPIFFVFRLTKLFA